MASEQHVTYAMYAVALLDLMGQRDRVNAMRKLQGMKPEERHSLFLETIGELTRLRESLQTALKSQAENFEKTPQFKKLPDKDTFRSLTHSDIKFDFFSDTLVMHTPLLGENSLLKVWDVHSIILACAVVLLDCFARGKAIRGGIELGIGSRWGSDEIYGPAFVDAYDLEKDFAQFPRVLVGDGVVDYLRAWTTSTDTSNVASMNRVLATDTFKLLSRADDGFWFVDWLGKESAQSVDHGHFMAHEAMKFIHGARRKHKNNRKLAPRYALLEAYSESRKHFWDASGSPSTTG